MAFSGFISNYVEPSELFVYLNKYVRIKLKPNVFDRSRDTCVQGWIYTIDPITLTHVLVDFGADDSIVEACEVTMVMHDHIESVEIVTTRQNELKERFHLIQEKLASLFRGKQLTNSCNDDEVSTAISDVDLQERRNKLIELLQKHRLPVKMEDKDGVINILDSVYINPPYKTENCQSSNEIILNRVRNLVNTIN